VQTVVCVELCIGLPVENSRNRRCCTRILRLSQFKSLQILYLQHGGVVLCSIQWRHCIYFISSPVILGPAY